LLDTLYLGVKTTTIIIFESEMLVGWQLGSTLVKKLKPRGCLERRVKDATLYLLLFNVKKKI
jgi:hypothetical protein